jgi:hypothetical protein
MDMMDYACSFWRSVARTDVQNLCRNATNATWYDSKRRDFRDPSFADNIRAVTEISDSRLADLAGG